MLQPEAYARLFEALKERNLTLINTPAEYENCHEFPLAYPAIADYTPGIRVYPEGEAIALVAPLLFELRWATMVDLLETW